MTRELQTSSKQKALSLSERESERWVGRGEEEEGKGEKRRRGGWVLPFHRKVPGGQHGA